VDTTEPQRKRTLGKGTWRRNVDGRLQMQLEEDGGDSLTL